MKHLFTFAFIFLFKLVGISQSTLVLAEQCFDNGDYPCAIAKYQEAQRILKDIDKNDLIIRIRKSTECAELIKVGNTYFSNKNYVFAKENYEKVLESNPKDPYAKMQIKKIKEILFIPSRIPTKVIGNLNKCASASNLETYTLEGGKLGSEDKFWRLMENGTEIRKFSTDTLRLSPKITTKYRIEPENSNGKSFEFEITINEAPNITGNIDGIGIICPGKQFTLKIEGFNPNQIYTLNWYKTDVNNKTRKFVGSGTQITDAIYANSSYEVEVNDKGCISERKLYKTVTIINAPLPPVLGNPNIKGSGSKKADVFITTTLNDKIEYEWSLDDFNSIYSRGSSLKGLKLNKGLNRVYVRAVNECGTASRVTKQDLVRQKAGFFFMNFGAIANDIEKINTAMVTFGSRGIYFRAKFNPVQIFEGQSFSTDFSNRNLEINNLGKVTNYPPSTGYYYTVNGIEATLRQGLTVGTNFGGKNVRFYLGGGYGERNMFWDLNLISYTSGTQRSSVFAKNVDQSWKGIEGEAGLFLKLGPFNVMAGGSAIYDTKRNSQFYDIHLGIGFSNR